jgi:hypothetical protein
MAENRPFVERLKLAGYKSIREADLKFTTARQAVAASRVL